GYTISGTSLVALAFQNHGHLVTNDPNKDIYQDVVQRGLNFIFDQLATQPLTVEVTGLNPMGYDPCAGDTGPAPCDGLAVNQGYTGYSTLMATLAVAAATGTAPTRLVADGLGANNAMFVAGKTYAQILQRLVDTIAWGQSNQQQSYDVEGGWRYTLNGGSD